MVDWRWTRLAGSLVLLAAAACGESTTTKTRDPVIEPPDPVPTVQSFQAAPEVIEAGATATLQWSTRDAASIRITDEGGVAVPVGEADVDRGAVEVQPTETTTYTLVAFGPGGEAEPAAWGSALVTVTAVRALAPTIEEFTASATTVELGGGIVLSWKTHDATEISLQDDAGVEVDLAGAGPAQGQVTVLPTRSPTTYSLVAVGAGRAAASVTVEVSGLPRISRFFLDPIVPIHAGDPVTLTWETVNTTRVVIRQDGAVVVDATDEPSGSRTYALTESALFELEATGLGRTSTAQLQARVAPEIVAFGADQRVVRAGDPVELTWAIQDADRALIDGPGDYHRAVGAADLASGHATVTVLAGGDFVLQAFRDDVAESAVLGIEVTDAPRIRSLDVDPGQVTAAASHPATVTLTWTQDGADSCTIFANNAIVAGFDGFDCATAGSAELQVRGDTTFRLVARNAAGEHATTASLEAVAPARIDLFAFAPGRRIAQGEAITLSWKASDAVAISMTRNDLPFPVDPTALTGSAADLVDADAVYVLTAVNSLGFPTSAEVSVAVGVPELLSVAADPDFVAIGSAFDLRWTANGGDRLVVADEGGQELLEVTDPATIDDGSTTVLAPVTPGTYTYTVTATNGDGPSSASVDVTVSDGPMIESFTAAPVEISFGETVTFTWSVRNDAHGNPPTLALADDHGHTYPEISGANQNNGTLTVTPAEEGRHVFTLTASTPNTTPHSVSVVVEVTVPPFLHAFTATPDVVYTQGGTVVPQVTLSWQSENAVEVTLWESDAAGNVTPPPFHRVSLPNDPQATLDAGSFLVEPTATTWYVARARNRVGSQVERIVKVTVDPPEILSFTATPPEIAEGDTAQLSWTTRAATAVRLDPMPPSVTRLGNTFIDISTAPGAVKSTVSGDYGVGIIPFPAGFTFPFAGAVYDRIQVCSNGWAGFSLSSTDSGGYSSALPSSYKYANFMLYGGDHDNTFNTGSGIWSGLTTDAGGDILVIQWKNWSWWSSSYRPSDLNFELILRPNGNFEYRYGTMTSNVPARANGLGANLGFQFPSTGSYGMNLVPYGTEVPGGLQDTGWAFDVQLPINGSFAVTPTATTTYTLTALNADASASAQTSVTVWKNPVLANVRTIPSAPVATQPFEVAWSATNATRIRVYDDAGALVCDLTDPVEIAAGTCSTVAGTQGPKTYSIVADNGPTGVAIATVTHPVNFSVFAYLAVTSLEVAPGEFAQAGDTVTLSWTTAGAVEILIEACVPRTTSCTDITPSPANPVAGSMTYTVQASTEFRLHAYDVMYRAADGSVSVWVGAGSLDTLTASTTQLLAGGSTTLSWTSTDIDSVSISPPLPLAPTDVSATAPYVDVSTGGGILAPFTGDADSGRWAVQFPAGFTFPWFGATRTGLVATTDGFLTFNTGYSGYDWSNSALPDSSNPDLHMAPFWDDGYAPSPAAVYFKLEQPASGARYLVVQWKDLELYSDSSSSLNFEVVLFENGDFDFRYGPMTSPSYDSEARGSSATIGFQSPDRTKSHQLSYNTAFPTSLTGRSWRYALNLAASGSVTVSPTASTTYRLCGTNESRYLSCREVRIVVVAPGDLLFSEALIAPANPAAEWFELRNLSPDPLDLAGWVLSSGTETFPIPAAPPLVVQPGGHVVFARSDAAGNGGFTPDVVYGNGSLTLDDVADTLALFFAGVPVDAVAWDATWTIPADQSLAVEPTRMSRNPAANDPASAWCPTTALYGTNTYGGSPGTEGPGCLPPPSP